jgi:alpha-tubulin suppressor-like RCC1 family protein
MRRPLVLFVLVAAGLALVPAPADAQGPEAALGGLRQVAAGFRHSCAVTNGGQVRCWGHNIRGQLGDNTDEERATPVTVLNASGTGPLVNVRQVVVGRAHSCALLTSGQVRCWGTDESGTLGNNGVDQSDRWLPVAVLNTAGTGNLTAVARLTAGWDHNCALLTNGRVRCWGLNQYGQIGDDSSTGFNSFTPSPVIAVTGSAELTGVTQVDAGEDHTCARLQNGQVRCWGWGPGLGRGSMTDSSRPVVTKNPSGTGPLTGVTQVTAGGFFSCARLTNGQARCWGDNDLGELGTGNTADRLRPAVVENPSGSGPLADVVQVQAGEHHGCALVGGGQVRCWGLRDEGQVGDGVFSDTSAVRPKAVRKVSGPGALTGATQIETNGFHTCARQSNGQARCWGDGTFSQLGNGGTDDRARPVVVQA